MKKTLYLIPLLALLLTACGNALLFTNTQTPTATLTYTPTQTLTPSPTLTPSITPSPTPKIFALGREGALADIAIRESDLLEFFKAIDVPTDGFVDGSIMTFKYGVPTYTKWDAPLPDNILFSYKTALQTNREWPDREPLAIALHSNAFYVFPDSASAHDFYEEDVGLMSSSFKLDMPTIGDESTAFTGYLKYNRPAGGVIWRYREVYVFFIAQLNFPVTAEALTGIARHVQDRLQAVID